MSDSSLPFKGLYMGFDISVGLYKDTISTIDVVAALDRKDARSADGVLKSGVSLVLKGRYIDLQSGLRTGFFSNLSRLTIYGETVMLPAELKLIGTERDSSPDIVIKAYTLKGKSELIAQGKNGTVGSKGADAWVQRKETMVKPGKNIGKAGVEDIEPEIKIEYIDHPAKDGTAGTPGSSGGTIFVCYVVGDRPTLSAPGGAGGKGGDGGAGANKYGHKLPAGKAGAEGAKGANGTCSCDLVSPEELWKGIGTDVRWANYRTALGLYHFAQAVTKTGGNALPVAVREFRAALRLNPDKNSDAAKYLSYILRGLRPNGMSRYADIIVDDLFFRAQLKDYLVNLGSLISQTIAIEGMIEVTKDLTVNFGTLQAAMQKAADIESDLLEAESEALTTEEQILINELNMLKNETDSLQVKLNEQKKDHENDSGDCLGSIASVVGLVASCVGAVFSAGATMAGAVASALSLVNSVGDSVVVAFGQAMDVVEGVVDSGAAILDEGISLLDDGVSDVNQVLALADSVASDLPILSSARSFVQSAQSVFGAATDFSKVSPTVFMEKMSQKAAGTRVDLVGVHKSLSSDAKNYPSDMQETLGGIADRMVRVARAQGELAALRIRKKAADEASSEYETLADSLKSPPQNQAKDYYEKTLKEYIAHAKRLLQHAGVFYFFALRSREILNAPGLTEAYDPDLLSLGYFHPDDNLLPLSEQLKKVKTQRDCANDVMSKWILSDAFFRASNGVDHLLGIIEIGHEELKASLSQGGSRILRRPELPEPAANTKVQEMRVWGLKVTFFNVDTGRNFIELTHGGTFCVRRRGDSKQVHYALGPRVASFSLSKSGVDSVYEDAAFPDDVTDYYSKFPAFRGRGVDTTWCVMLTPALVSIVKAALENSKNLENAKRPSLRIEFRCIAE